MITLWANIGNIDVGNNKHCSSTGSRESDTTDSKAETIEIKSLLQYWTAITLS